MRIPQVTDCCCGCSLRTATLIIGWAYLIFAGIITLGASAGSEATAKYTQTITRQSGGIYTTEIITRNSDLHQRVDYVVFSLVAIFSAFNFFISIMLLYAVYKKKLILVFSWMIIDLIVLFIIDIFIIGIMLLHGILVFGAVVLMICSLLKLYFLMVVYSYYRENKDFSSSRTMVREVDRNLI